MKNFVEKILNLDKRWIFLAIFISVTLPLFIPIGLSIHPSKEVIKVFKEIENSSKSNKPVLVSFDYDPGSIAELNPMAKAILTHLFYKNIPVLITHFVPTGKSIAENISFEIASKYNKEYGKDYLILGYKAASIPAILNMGADISRTFEVDSIKKRKINKFSIMNNVKNYNNISLIIDLASTALPEIWIIYAGGQYKAKIAICVTAVLATNYFPYLQSGQAIGMLAGMKGAAEYESLLLNNNITQKLGNASKGLDSQSIAHLVIVILILLGNFAYLIKTKKYRS